MKIEPILITFRRWGRGTPVTVALVALNLLAFLLLVLASGSPLEIPTATLIAWGGNDGSLTLAGEPWRLLSSVFLHGGLLHVGLNMLALFQAGQLVERMYGSSRYLAIYLFAGLFASLSSVWWRQDVVSIGASGAIFGVFGALLSFLAANRRRLNPDVYRRMRTMTLSFVGYSLLLGFAIPGVDNAAHVGGLAAGLAAGWLVCHWSRHPAAVGACLVMLATVAMLMWAKTDPPAHASRAVAEFAAVQPLLAERQQEVLAALSDGRLDKGEALHVIEQELKPNWDQLIAGLKLHSEQGDRQAARLLAYAQLERSALDALSLGLSTGHPSWLSTAASLRVEANRALQAFVESTPHSGYGLKR